jgi:hypothetical protein
MTYPRRKGRDLIACSIAGQRLNSRPACAGLASLESVRIVVDAVAGPIAGALRTGLDTLRTLTLKVRVA